MLWSRIVPMANLLQENSSSFLVEVDLKNVPSQKEYGRHLQIDQFKPHFDPKKYVKDN